MPPFAAKGPSDASVERRWSECHRIAIYPAPHCKIVSHCSQRLLCVACGCSFFVRFHRAVKRLATRAFCRWTSAADEAELDDIYETERRLLYVACTRAREHLLLTGVTPASEYLADLEAKAG
jgi:hypothetical protein